LQTGGQGTALRAGFRLGQSACSHLGVHLSLARIAVCRVWDPHRSIERIDQRFEAHLASPLASMAGDRRHTAVACTLLATLLACAEAASFTETIDSTWADRWTHSTAEKYNGKFVAEAPPGLPDELALKVRPLGGLDPSRGAAAA